MLEKLLKLRNTLALVETRGENTKLMADCLRFVELLIAESESEVVQNGD